MEHKTLKDYLFASAVLETGNAEEIAAAKRKFRRLYMKWKKEEFRKTHRSVTLSFPNKEAKRIEQEALRYGLKLPAYLKQCIYAYRNKTFILPNEQQVRQLELLLRNIGNNVNQIAHKCNALKLEPPLAIAQVQRQIDLFDKRFTALFREPPDMAAEITKILQQNPKYLLHLLAIITECLRQQLHGNKDLST